MQQVKIVVQCRDLAEAMELREAIAAWRRWEPVKHRVQRIQRAVAAEWREIEDTCCAIVEPIIGR